ncbi:MAG: hypothetical protein WBB94_00905 [Candidatus Saccharimonadaceae bacterium]
MRKYDVIKPANQTELTSTIRNRDLAGMALGLIVIASDLDELAIRRGDVAEEGKVDFLVDNIVGLYGIPYLTGRVTEHHTADDDKAPVNVYSARLEVNGTETMAESDRTLSLYVSRD